MASPDVSITTNAFVEKGGPIFGKHVLGWDLRKQGIQVRTNVNAPQAMIKLSSQGTPQPYATADATSGNAPKFTDRVLTAYQSKWDWDFDPEEFRNTYLANDPGMPFYEAAVGQMAKEYLDYLIRLTLYAGVRNGSGTAPADINDGWGTIIAALVTATTLTEIATGALSSSNAVTKFELVAEGVPAWMREMGFRIYCSYANFDNFIKHYRATYGFSFDKSPDGIYKLDNKNCIITPSAWMGTSGRLIATIDNNLVFGTDIERISLAASQRRNIIEVRQLMPVGMQIQDTDAIFVNDQA
jgi:hypothetical protein